MSGHHISEAFQCPRSISEAFSVSPLDLVIESNRCAANHLATLAALLQQQIGKMRTRPEFIRRKEAVNAFFSEMVGKCLAVPRLHRIVVNEPYLKVLSNRAT
jgi:hypothetical protein